MASRMNLALERLGRLATGHKSAWVVRTRRTGLEQSLGEYSSRLRKPLETDAQYCAEDIVGHGETQAQADIALHRELDRLACQQINALVAAISEAIEARRDEVDRDDCMADESVVLVVLGERKE